MGQLMKHYKVISLFSGAMGLDVGIERTGRFEVIVSVEKEKAFADSIEANKQAGRIRGRAAVFNEDISKLDPAEVMKAANIKPGELDLLVGGPPCQSFSTAGKRGTVQDHRGTLLWQYLRYVQALKPKFFLMENVRGLLSAALRHRPIAERPENGGPPLEADEQPGSVVRSFAENLQKTQDATYHMDCFEVNAVNYGAPQLRERALFIGNRFNSIVEFPRPTHSAPQDAPNNDTFPLFAGTEEQPLAWKTLRDALVDLKDEDPVVMDFSPRKKRYLAMVPPGSNWRSLPVEIQKESMGKAWFAKGGRSGWWRRLSFDLPCPTLMTMPNHAGTSLCHPTETRALTLREYARIQEFPDDWEFRGTPAERYAQVGNAVPVRLGEVAGTVIAKQLDVLAKRRFSTYAASPPAYRIVYVQSHVRTRQWFKDGKTLLWEDGEDKHKAVYGIAKTKLKSKMLLDV